jgi:hypothetical protein
MSSNLRPIAYDFANHYENKIGYYKHIYFYIIHYENKSGYYKHRLKSKFKSFQYLFINLELS